MAGGPLPLKLSADVIKVRIATCVSGAYKVGGEKPDNLPQAAFSALYDMNSQVKHAANQCDTAVGEKGGCGGGEVVEN